MDNHDTTKEENQLSVEDVKSILAENDKYKKLPTTIFDLDLQSTETTIVIILIWIVLWMTLGLFKITGQFGIYVFYGYIALCVFNLVNSATDVSDSDSERINLATQQNYIQGGLSIFIMLLVFLANIPLESKTRMNIYVLIILSLLICCTSIAIINLKNTSINIRYVRKIQQGLFNQSLFLFVLCLLIMLFEMKGAVVSNITPIQQAIKNDSLPSAPNLSSLVATPVAIDMT